MTAARFSPSFLVATMLLVAGLLLGGSASQPTSEMLLSILALAGLLLITWTERANAPSSRLSTCIILTLLALFLFQLVPLPAWLWNRTHGGIFAHALPEGVGYSTAWPSLSIAPDRTLYSLIASIPSLLMLWMVPRLSLEERLRLAAIFVVCASLMAMIGILQAAGALGLSLYDYHHPNVAIGLYASRNHYADLLLIGVALGFASQPSWTARFGAPVTKIMVHCLVLLFLAAMVGSASRSGVALFALVVIAGYAVNAGRHRWRVLAGGIALVGALVATINAMPQTGVVKTLVGRFAASEEGRWEIWQNSIRAIEAYWPSGSGIGTFRLAYEQGEPLHDMTPSFINAAHDEYLQLLIEGGLIAAIAACVIVIVVLVRAIQNWKRPIVPFSSIALAAVLAHSAVDYPFRVVTNTILIAMLCGFILAARHSRRDRQMGSGISAAALGENTCPG